GALRVSALLEAGIIAATAILVGGALGSGLTRLAVGEWPGTVTYRSAGLPIALAAALVGLLVVGTLLPIVFARRGPLTNAEPESRAIFGPAVLQLAVSLAVVTTSALIARHAAGVAQSGRTHGG